MKEEMKKFFINSSIYALGNNFVLAIGMIAIILYAPYMSSSDFGILGITNAVTSVIAIFSSFGINSAGIYFYFRFSKDEDKRKSFYGSLVFLTLLICLFFLFFLEIFGNAIFYMILGINIYRPYIQISLWSIFLYNFFHMIPLAIFKAREQSMAHVFLYSGPFLFSTVLSVVFVILFSKGALGIIFSIFISNFFFSFFGLHILSKNCRLKIDLELMKQVISYVLPLIPDSLCHWILSMMPTLFLIQYVGLSQLGIFSLTLSLIAGFQAIIFGVNSAFCPFFAKANENRKMQDKLPRMITYYFFILFLLYLIITSVLEAIFCFFLPSEYQSGINLILLLSASKLFLGFYFIPVNIIVFTAGKIKYLPLFSVISAVFSIFLCSLLIPCFSIFGAVLAMALSYAFLFFLYLFLSFKIFSISWELKRISKLLTSFFFVLILKLVFSSHTDLISFIILSIALILLFLLCLVLQKFFTSTEIPRFRLNC